MSARQSVLFVCVHNAGKSQMAAGARPGGARGRQLGADMSGETPTLLDRSLLLAADRVVVLGAEADVEPIPGMRASLVRWIIEHPADRGIGGLERVWLMRDDIDARVRSLLVEMLGGSLSA